VAAKQTTVLQTVHTASLLKRSYHLYYVVQICNEIVEPTTMIILYFLCLDTLATADISYFVRDQLWAVLLDFSLRVN
jgi:hypothetical protein